MNVPRTAWYDFPRVDIFHILRKKNALKHTLSSNRTRTLSHETLYNVPRKTKAVPNSNVKQNTSYICTLKYIIQTPMEKPIPKRA